jgi:CopA family copper-resistance protein
MASPQNRYGAETLRGNKFDLNVAYQPVNFTGKDRMATAVNGSVPAPTLRWREGDRVTLSVTNNLAEDSSIHWHGLILPTEMDGVPGLSFDGIKPGETFEYEFDLQQSGTYWYHSHSGFQEPTGMYGAIVIDPKEPDPVAEDRDYVVMLSDWSDEKPQAIYAKLKKLSHYYNFRERTVFDLWRDLKDKGVAGTWREREMWNQMRMSQTDISDVTGYTYTYLMNGVTPDEGWLGLFKKGEKIRLRFINGASMTLFDVRIPGLKMTVVASDGQNVQAVTVDEFRIAPAETYDVIVEPSDDRAYTVFAQNIDRTGYARGTLTPELGLTSSVPNMDRAPVLGHREMGMGMAMSMNHDMAGMDHSKHRMGGAPKPQHVASEDGPHVDMQAENPQSGLHDPGMGLRDHESLHGRKVLTYADLKNLYPTVDRRAPGRDIELHLTGNMNRYMWSLNGIKFADAEPLQLKHGERVRITLVNDTMMSHPMHLHGLWSELETGDSNYLPRKHTVIVQPGSKITYLVSADALGRWAYHCHLTYHMPGMFREVRVS